MSDSAFNGTTVSFAGTPIPTASIRSVKYSGSCAKPSTTGSGATVRLHKCGLPKRTTTVVVVGASTLVKGATGALVVVWADGGTKGSFTKARLMKKPSMSGSLDGDNTTTLVFAPSK